MATPLAVVGVVTRFGVVDVSTPLPAVGVATPFAPVIADRQSHLPDR